MGSGGYLGPSWPRPGQCPCRTEAGKEGLTQIPGQLDGLAGPQELISARPCLLPQSRAVVTGNISHKAGGGW